MRHPLSGKALRYYLSVWGMIIIAHTTFLHLGAGFSLDKSLLDSVVFNLMLAAFGFIYWYVVKFLSLEKQGFTNIMVSHFLGTAFGASLVAYLSIVILSLPASGELAYQIFLQKTLFWRIVIALFYMTLIIMLYYLLQNFDKIRRKEQDEISLQNMLKNAELEMLKFQLNPHFIFNSLNSISSLTLTDPERAREMIIRLSDFLRTSLGKKQAEIHSLKDELQQMSLYLEIEKVRFGSRLEIKDNVSEECHSMLLPNMILQPIYENAIKHGLYEQLGKLTIETTAVCKNELLQITVKNNYDPESVVDSRKGIGLQNIRNRLMLIYGRDDLVQVKKENGIFEIDLTIPGL